MRWTLRMIAIVLVLLAAYAAWPYFALYDLANAVQKRDVAAVSRRVNFPAVRQSLAEQIVVTYLRLSGRDARLGEVGRGLAVSAVLSIADPIVAKIISAEALMALLNNGWPTFVLPDKAADVQGLSRRNLGNFWQVFVASEQGLRRFAIPVPAGAPPGRQLKLQFRLTTWTWKLSGVELPEELRLRLAQELIKHADRK